MKLSSPDGGQLHVFSWRVQHSLLSLEKGALTTLVFVLTRMGQFKYFQQYFNKRAHGMRK